nr:hypothetical protein [Rickettsia endosymbiont of Ceutorhynchus assimilis]
MKFKNAGSILNITSNGNVTATMNGDLDPGAAASGVIQLSSTGGLLEITGANNLGIAGPGNTLNSITFAGNGNITVTPTINTANAISTGITGNLILGNVNAGINFTAATNLTVNNVTGNIDFKGQTAAALNLTANSTITGTVDSTVGVGGKLNLAANTTVTGVIGGTNPLTAVNFNGAGINLTAASDANLFTVSGGASATAGGLMTGAVNYGVGAGKLTVQNGINGAVTSTAGGGEILTINGGDVTGTIGTNVAAINLVNIGANPVIFGASVFANTVALTDNASALTLGNNVALTGVVTTANANNGILTFNPGSSVSGTIGTNAAALAKVNIGAGAAAFGANVWADAVQLTNVLSVLTLNNATVNGAITNTSGNNNSGTLILNPGSSVNGIIGANAAALAAVNIGAGAASFGANVFSKVVALTNGLSVLTLNNGVTVNGAITTAANNNGSLTFTRNSSVTGTIGTGGAALNTVTFTGDTTLAQPSFSQTFTVNNGANTIANALMTGAVTLAGNGTLDATGGGVTGSVAAGSGTFKGNVGGSGSVGAGGTFTGNVSTSAIIAGGNFIGNVGTTASFTGAGTLTTGSVGGLTDFAGKAGTVDVTDGGTLAGVTSSAGNFIGNLNFLAGANVTGAVSNIGAISLGGVGGKIVNFQQDVKAASLKFFAANTANLLGSLTTTGNVDFGGGGTLEFSGLVGGINPANYTFNSTVANGNTGILAVNTTLIATNADIGKVKTINIGAGKIFTVDASAGAVNLLQAAASTITFGDANSVFGLTTNTAQTVTFNNSLNGGAGNTGIVNLNGNGNTLTLAGNTGVETLGGANTLAVLNVSGNVTISGAAGTTKLDVSNTAVLNLAPASVFTDQSLTSATVGAINIGDNTGPATYALDAVNAPIVGPVGKLPEGHQFDLTAKVNFANPASILKLQSTAPSGINSIVSLLGDFDPGAVGGIVELNSANKGANLIIDDRGFTFGTAAHPLKQLTFSGQGPIAIVAKTFTPEILLNIAEIGLTNVISNITYATNTQFGVGSITGNMDFANQAGTAIFASSAVGVGGTAQITGNITSTGGPNGTVVFMDNGIIGGTVTNLAMFKGGADGSIVRFNTGGNMSISEIQGTGTGTILFAQATPTDLEGVVNQTGGTAVDLVFPSGGSISGDVGSANNPIGTITAQAGVLILEGKVTGDTAFMIDGATIQFNDDINIGIQQLVTPAALMSPAPLAGAVPNVRFNSATPETDAEQVGTSTVPVSIQINGNDVTFTNNIINISNIDFTSPQAVTATFASQNAIVGGATTNANRLHTIAISGDLTTGTLPFGSDSNHLKTVQFNGVDSKITIDSENFYSSITTKTNNQGTAIFNANNGFTDDLGGENLSLKLVQFSSNKGTVKGDTYAKNITIDAGKSAVFTGYNSRSLDIPAATVGGVKVPRATTKFNYKTKIVSDNFKGSSNSSAEYTNAVLLQAPINGGSHKFDDDVWLQKPVTGANTITFAPQKTAFIQSDLGASNIVADQATMMFTGDNASVNVGGNISGSNMTLDLGNNKIIYTGNAKPTGELTINVLYDTVNSGVENNTDSGNIVIANGANIDLSGVTALKVLLTAASNPASISANSAYPIITSLSGNGITVGNAANLPFNVTANEGVFVRWVINASSFILYPIETTGDITVDNIIKNIITAPPGTDAAKVANVIVNTPIGQRKVVVDHLIPIIERPSITIHKITQINHPFIIPETPIIGPIGGYSPSVPVTGGVVGVNPNGPAVVGTGPATGGSVIGGTFTPNGPAVVGTGPNGPGTGGVVGVGPNGPAVVGTGPAAGGSVIGGTFTLSGPAVVGTGPNGPGTGGVVGVGPNGPAVVGTGPATGGSVIGGTFTPSGPAVVGTGPNGPGTGGVVGVGPNGPAVVGTGPVIGGSVIGGTFTPSGPAVVGTGPNGPGTGGVVGVGPNGPAVVGTGPATGGSVIGGTFTPSGPAVVGTGPNGPGTGGVVGVGPNGPAVVGTGPAAGGSVIGGTFTPSGPAVVGTGPNGPGTGGVVGVGPNGPGTGPVIGGSVIGGTFTPSGPAVVGTGPNGPGTGGVVGVGPNGPAVVGTGPAAGGSVIGGTFTPSGPAVVGTGPNGPGTGGVVGVGPNGPAVVGTGPVIGGSVIGGTFTPSGPAVVGTGPNGPGTGGVVGVGPNGPAVVGTGLAAGGSVIGGTFTPSGPAVVGTGPNGPGTGGVVGVNPNGPAVVGTGPATGGSVIGGTFTPSGPAVVGTDPNGPGTGRYSPSAPGGSTGGTSVNGPASVGSSVTPGGSNYTPSIGSGSTSVNGPASVGSSVTSGGSNYTPSIGSGGTSVNGPASVGSSVTSGGSNYTPSIGSGSTSVNGPASVGSSVTPGGSNYTPSIGSGSTSVNGPASVGSSVTPGGSNYTPSIGSGSTSVNGPASVGSSVTPGGSNYTPSIGSGGTSVNGPASVGSSVTPGGSNYTPSIGSGSTSVNGPASVGSSVTPGGSNYTPSIGSGSTSVNGPASVGSSVTPGGSNYTPSIGSGSTSVNGPASVGSSVTPGGSNYTPSIGSGSTSVNGPASVGSSVTPGGSNYTPSIGSGSTSVNGPASVGSSVTPGGSNYTPSIGSGSTSVNGPASVGSSVTPGGSNYTPSIGSGSTSVNGPASVGSSVTPGGSNYTPSIGSGSTSVNGPASVGSSVTPGGSNYTPSIGSGSTSVNGPASVGSSVTPGGSNYTPSIGSGSTSVNGPASVGSSVTPGGSNYTPSIGSGSTSVNGPASVGSSVTPGGSNYTLSIGSGSTSVNGPASVGSSVNPGGSNYTPFGNNVGTSATSPSAATIGSSGNSNIPAASTNSVGSNAVGGSSINTNNSSAGNSRGGSSGSNMPIIETGKDSSIGSSGNSSGVSSGAASTGATTTNPNDGFDAARGNTNAGTKEVSDRTSKIRDAENAPDTIPSEQDQGVSRKRGAAVGAGDCDSNEIIYGLWGAPYFGKATQKQQNNLMGYKAKSAGGSIGVDTLINDNIVVGAAYTKVDTKLNYQGAKAANHTKVNTDMFSAYGLYNFINNWFVEGITSYSRSIIKTNEIRNIINGTETAHGKYRSYSYSGQVVGGYNYLWNETTLSPMVGLRLAKIKDSGYHEFGTSFQNLTIKKRQYNKVEGIAGGEIKTTFYKGEFLIRPQVHAFINYDFKGKTPPIIAELNGLTDPLTVPTPKATKMLYDLGAGVEFKKGRMEYGLHYGLNLAKKYQAQSGTIKIKVNL